jgi:cadmium resistance protein CadD (predicted permease)
MRGGQRLSLTFLGKEVPLMVTYEAMNMMISLATFIIAVVALGISANKKK